MILVEKEKNIIKVQGTVTETLPNASFKVELESGAEILAEQRPAACTVRAFAQRATRDSLVPG